MSARATALLALALSACSGARPAPEPSVAPQRPPVPVARSVEGRPIVAHVVGDGARTALFLGTIHGNEAAGTPLLERFLGEARATPEWLRGWRVVVVPVTNPDGRARGVRRNANGVDLNRNFPATSFRRSSDHGPTALSEPEARAIAALVREHAPERIVSLHQPLAVVDWDGPGEALARAVAAAGPLPARKLGARPGSLGAWAGETLGVPTLTLELPRNADQLDATALWKRYGNTLVAALTTP